MNVAPKSRCVHIGVIGDYTKNDIIAKLDSTCDTCEKEGPYLYVCLHRDCLYVGCNDTGSNHCIKHFQQCVDHCLFLNLTSLRVYCLVCEGEVFLENNDPPVPGMLPPHPAILTPPPDPPSDSDEEIGDEEVLKPRGLTGLQNLGNTCYMNSALQALSNCPQLTNFFLECGSFVRFEKKPGLAKSYLRLIKEMWHRKRPSYVVPSGIAYGVKIVCPVFRGFTQQDAQEFLRCFMDQLHEELKEPIVELSEETDPDSGLPVSEGESDGDYETCDSGLSSEKDDHSLDPASELLEEGVVVDVCSFHSHGDYSTCKMATNPDLKDKCSLDSCLPSSDKEDIEERPLRWRGSHSNRLKTLTHKVGAQPKAVQYRSVISDTFDGKLLSSVQCLTCDTVSTTEETFQDLSLPIPSRDHLHLLHAAQGGTCTDSHRGGWVTSFFDWILSWLWSPSVSLEDCLSAFFSADELKGDNMYSCDKCKKLRNGIKYSKLSQLPEMLCIHLKRFRHEVMFSSKLGNYVSFPLEGLDVSPFLNKSSARDVATYDLTSVICHHGTAGSGHYTAYSLNYLNDQWYEFDDQYVTMVDPETVRNCEAYVLFYRKCGEEMSKKRLCAVELMERSRTEHGLLKFHISKQWINKFNNFAEPGPISNTDFLCPHGGVPPQKAAFADELCTVLPQAVWEYLHDTFGGGPPCTHLYICNICHSEQDALNHKRKMELHAMHSDLLRMDNPSAVCAISMSWFKTWENFICRDGEPPLTAIDNNGICYVKNNQTVLKLASDYCTISREMYQYLQSIYGGGPDVVLHSTPHKPSNVEIVQPVEIPSDALNSLMKQTNI